MDKLTCQQLSAKLEEIQQLFRTININAPNISNLLDLSENLKVEAEKLEDLIVPFNYGLRQRLAKKIGVKYLSDFHESLAKAFDGEKWFYINQEGINIFPTLDFDEAGNFSGGYAKVKKTKKYSILDKKGQKHLINNTSASDIGEFNEGKSWWLNGLGAKYFIGEVDGKPQIIFRNHEPRGDGSFKNGIAIATKIPGSPQVGVYFINKEGEKIINETFHQAWNFDGEKALVNNFVSGKYIYYFIDKQGNKTEIPNLKNHIIKSFSKNGIASEKKLPSGERIFYFTDSEGKIIRQRADIKFLMPSRTNTLIIHKDDGECQITDIKGLQCVPGIFISAKDMGDGVFKVTKKDGEQAYIDIYGQEIFKN